MALKRNERYPGRYSNPSTDHPQGAFKNRTAPSAQDGSYLEQDWTNDWDGFFGRLLTVAGITPNGDVDTAQSSQYYTALAQLFVAAGSLGNSATRNVGTTSGTVAAGDDSRIVNAVQLSNPALCTAWVNFNGITPATIKSAYNVSSVTRLSTGKYQINFTKPMVNNNYAPSLSIGDGAATGSASPVVMLDANGPTGNPLKTVNNMTMYIRTNAGSYDSTEVNAIFFGGM